MGKVTVIIESDQLSTDNLESIVRWKTATEADYELEAYERYQTRPSIRIYIVPGDED